MCVTLEPRARLYCMAIAANKGVTQDPGFPCISVLPYV